MHIAWRYLDTRTAAVEVLLDYRNMERIIELTPDKLETKQDFLHSPRSPVLNGMPPFFDPHSGERVMVELIDDIDKLLVLQNQAKTYMAWVQPAMAALTDRERHILSCFYMSGSRHSGANTRLQEELGYSSRQIDRFRAQALTRFTRLLFGI